MNFYEKLYQNGIVPVVKINRAEQAADLARALLAGGISVIELTYRSAAAGQAIRMIAREVPEICICAGTVLSQAQAKEALDAGAKAILSGKRGTCHPRCCHANRSRSLYAIRAAYS